MMAGDAGDKMQRKKLYSPTLRALEELGGSGANYEIHDKAVAIIGLTDKEIDLPYETKSRSTTVVKWNLEWARTDLNKAGLIANIGTGLWAITPKGRSISQRGPDEVEAQVIALLKEKRLTVEKDTDIDSSPVDDESTAENEWRGNLIGALKEMDPGAFERLCQLMLRKNGFTQVKVTGQSGDGGIDGIGVVRISGFLSFRVLFQCKRYKGSVTAGTVRDFRGAMTGRTDKGLIVTTGRFTRDAQREARRDGAPEIDLIDGEQLIDKLKELKLGVTTEQVVTERVTVDESFFAAI